MNETTQTIAHEDSEAAATSPVRLNIQILSLEGKGIPGLGVRIKIDTLELLKATDDEGRIDALEGEPSLAFELAVKRLDGSFKTIDICTLPGADAAWTYVSPKLEIEVATELHEGAPGTAEQSIPNSNNSDIGQLVVEVDSNSSNEENYSNEGRNKPVIAAPLAKGQAVAIKPPQHIANEPMPVIMPQSGRNKAGNPLAVIQEKFYDWWGSWRMPTFNLWSAAVAAQKREATPQTGVPLRVGMKDQVQTLIEFATEQANYEYSKRDTAASIVASMTRGEFKHVHGEKAQIRSVGLCYKYVKVALVRTRIIDTVPSNEAASEAGPQLVARGFVDVTDAVPDARWAAAGDVIVYAWSTSAWEKRRTKYQDPNVPNYGHIDIRSTESYISDFVHPANHPSWSDYTNIRIYRKAFDILPVLRIHAFLHCLRDYECTSESDDSKRYKMLNTALPSGSKTCANFELHPWATIPDSKRGRATAAGAYQITYSTWKEVIDIGHLNLAQGEDAFSPKIQDRIAVIKLESRQALPLVRSGEIKEAIGKLLTEWTSLPGGSQNANRRDSAGNPMDIEFFLKIFEAQLAVEKRKVGM